MSNYISWAFETSARCMINDAEQGEDQIASISLMAIGALTTLGALYYLNNNRNYFVSHAAAIWNQSNILANTCSAASGVWLLSSSGILTQENIHVLLANGGASAWDIANALRRLHEAGILIPENRNAFLADGGVNAWNIARCIWLLSGAGILTQENLDVLFTNGGTEAWNIASALRRMNEAGILTDENRNAFMNGDDERLREILTILTEIEVLNQERFDEAIDTANANAALSCKCALDESLL